jgi:ribosomal subunit interface protein
MHLYITARDFELTEPIREYVQRRLVHGVEAHSNPQDLQRMEVQLYQVGDGNARFGCHVLLQLSGHLDINIREEATDLYEAIDRGEKRLQRQLVDQRERRLSNRRHA